MQALRRVAAAMGLALAGLLAAPLAQADTGTPHPISRTEGASRVMAVTAGSRHTCALQPDGSVACWGHNYNGQLGDALVGGNYGKPGPFLAVPAGDAHTCGLKPDGSLACWGQNNYGQAPASVAGPFLAVSAGGDHTCGLKPNGSVACWGRNNNGQAPASVAGPFLAVSAGDAHTCGLKPDGSVACWGSTVGGQLGDALVGGIYGKPGPFLAVSAGAWHTCGLKPDGSVTCWGENSHGQLGDALVDGNYGKPGPFLAVSAGALHTCGLKPDGSVACWGNNGSGQLGDALVGGNYGKPGPFLAVSAGELHTCGLKPDGSVACWGNDNNGQSTVPAALQAPGNTAFGQIAAGNAHACQVRRDGSAACWGDNAAGQTTAPAGTFTQVVAGEHHSCALTADSRVTCWGGDILYPFGSGDAADRFSSVVALQSVESCGLKLDGSMKCWHPFHTRTAAGPFRNLAGNGSRVCAIATNGTGRCWTPGNAPGAPIPGNWQVLQPGLNHQCGLKVDGSIECMGDNSSGQRTGAPLATAKFRALSVGWNHACAIRTNGELACWGSNVNGQTSAPAGTFVQVAAGNTFTCAIRSDGVRLCWGAGNHGQVPFLQLLPASETLAGGLAGSAHAGVQFALTDGGGLYPLAAPAAFAVVDGALPPGMALSADGLLSGTPTAVGDYSFTVEGEDANGFVGRRGYFLSVIADNSPPVIGYTLTPPTPDGNNGWYRSNVDVSWSVDDAESAISSKTGCTPSTLSTDSAGASYTCSATSAGGSASKTTPTLKRDATAPTISAAATTTANPNGWYRGNVAVAFSCNDATSGIATCPATQTLATEGTAVSSTAATAQDNAGNTSAPSNVVTVQIDRTAPTLAPTVSSASIPVGGSAVVSPNAADALSGLASASCGTPDTSTVGTRSVTCTATDKAGNTRSVSVPYTVVDVTAPVVTYTLSPAAPNANGWYRGNVGVTWTVRDPESGVATQTGCAASTVSSDTAGTRYTCTATNGAGLRTSVSTPLIKRDSTPPALAPVVSPNPILRNGTGNASANAADALSGIASQSCASVDTSIHGNRTLTCTATDNAGNTATAQADYVVQAGRMVSLLPAVPARALGGVVPFIPTVLRWTVVDANGVGVTGLRGTLTAVPLACPAWPVSPINTYVRDPVEPMQDLGGGRYQATWTAPATARGKCWTLKIDLGDGLPIEMPVKVY
ncbi:hypothetical protein MASR1M8_13740 [Thermomonas brevis]